MNVCALAMFGAMSTLIFGCQSQEAQLSAGVSLQSRAEDREDSVYEQVELVAGSGAEEDEPVDEEAEPEELEPDAGTLEQRVKEAQGYSDDSHLCGNGELDEGELCDPFILEGEGVCPERCDPPPGCPDEALVIRGCQTHCMPEHEPSEECLASR